NGQSPSEMRLSELNERNAVGKSRERPENRRCVYSVRCNRNRGRTPLTSESGGHVVHSRRVRRERQAEGLPLSREFRALFAAVHAERGERRRAGHGSRALARKANPEQIGYRRRIRGVCRGGGHRSATDTHRAAGGDRRLYVGVGELHEVIDYPV